MNQSPAFPPPASILQTGRLLEGRYQLDTRIGRGAVGEVWRARDTLLEVDVALKVLRRDKPDALGRALDHEARELLRLDHPNICRAYRLAHMDGLLVLVLELLPGADLNKVRKAVPGNRLDLELVLRAGLDAASGLSHAHLKGIRHNDLKPGNLFLHEDGHVLLLDFGLSQLSDAEVLGTPTYMDSHRAETGQGNSASDVYGLAATLYTLATGHPPFGKGVAALSKSRTRLAPPSPYLPKALHTLLAACMAPRVEQRPDLVAMREGLLMVADELGVDITDHVEALEHTPPPTDARAVMAGYADAHGGLPADSMVMMPATEVHLNDRTVQVPAFLFGLYPVTNRDYAAFVADTGHAPPRVWRGTRPPAGRAMHPVTGIRLEDARAFAAWMGVRLPTVSEWLAALRGNSGRSFPWGRACDPSICHCPLSKRAPSSRPVDAEPRARTAEGVWDMLGNTWEWTEPTPELAETARAVVAGGGFRQACGALSGRAPLASIEADAAYDHVGFRLAQRL